MDIIHNFLINPGIAKFISLFIAIIMGLLSLSPINIVVVYLFFRPIVQPYAYHKYTIINGVPLTAIFPVILIISAFLNSFVKEKYSLIYIRLIPLYLIIFFSTLSFYNTPGLAISIGGVLKLLTAIAIYMLVFNSIQTENDIRKILWIYVLCTIIPMSFGYYQYLTATGHAWKSQYYAGKRIDSFLGEWNAYGEFLCIGIAAILALLNMKLKKKWHHLLKLFLGSMIISLVLSLNRGSWVSLGIGIITATIVYWRRISIVKITAGIVLIMIMFGGIIFERFSELKQTNSVGMSKNTLENRIEGWKNLIPLIVNHPIAGNGLDASLIITKNSIGPSFAPHNDYLRMALELGIPAAILYFIFLFGQVWFALGRFRQKEYWQINFSLMILSVYFLIISVLQNIFTNQVVFPMFMGLLAIGHRIPQIGNTIENDKIE